MKAPSEKHLEDWLAERGGDLFTDRGWDSYPEARLIARQFKLGTHRADLLVVQNDRMLIAELKVGELDTKALAQCLRYMGYLQRIWHHVVKEQGYSPELAHAANAFCLSGLLIGHSISDDVLTAAFAANISVYLYDYINDGYTFRFAGINQPAPKYLFPHDAVQDYAYGYIGESMRQILSDYVANGGDYLVVDND